MNLHNIDKERLIYVLPDDIELGLRKFLGYWSDIHVRIYADLRITYKFGSSILETWTYFPHRDIQSWAINDSYTPVDSLNIDRVEYMQ